MFRVKLTKGPFPENHEIKARAGGRLKKYSIRVIPGDEVTVEISVYDLTKGRIIYRQSGSSYQKKS
jgi:translation initiation factor IF-1